MKIVDISETINRYDYFRRKSFNKHTCIAKCKNGSGYQKYKFVDGTTFVRIDNYFFNEEDLNADDWEVFTVHHKY